MKQNQINQQQMNQQQMSQQQNNIQQLMDPMIGNQMSPQINHLGNQQMMGSQMNPNQMQMMSNMGQGQRPMNPQNRPMNPQNSGLLVKKTIHDALKPDFIPEFLKMLSESDTISKEAQTNLFEYAKTLITKTAQFSINMAVKRNSASLEVEDLKYAIGLNIKPKEKQEIKPTQQHIDNMDLLEQFRRNKRENKET